MEEKKLEKELKNYWQMLGPGLTTGGADDDPTAIIAATQAGARFGFQLIWINLFVYPFMAVVQEMCARIGIVSGQGLAANIRREYPASALYIVTALLFLANILGIAASLGAMAASARLFVPHVPAEVWVVGFALLCLALEIGFSYARYAKYLKYLTLTLLSYVVVALLIDLDWSAVLYHTLVPSIMLSQDQLFLMCALLGTAISPYLFFWQTSQEVEEKILLGETSIPARRAQANPRALRAMRIDVWSGMGFSNIITFFIFATAAGTLYAHGVTNITTADQAALALQPFGAFATVLFAVGIIGTGLLSVPVLAGSTAYAISEGLKWKNGLYRSFRQAHAFYGVIIISVLLGIAANLARLDPIQGLLYAAFANGIIAPFVLFFVVRLASNKRVMGEHANRPFISFIGWLTIGLMSAAGAATLITSL